MTDEPPAPTAQTPPPRGLRSSTALLLILAACVMAGSGIVAPVLPLYGAAATGSATLVGMLITIFGIARLAANLPTGLLFPRLGSRRLLVAGSILLVVGGAGAALAGYDLAAMLVWRAVQGVGCGIFLTTIGVLVALRTEPGRRGRFLARYQAAVFVGAGIGPTVGGYLAAGLGIAAPFWAYAAVAALALVASIVYVHPRTALTVEAETGPRVPLWRAVGNPQQSANLAVSFSQGFVRTAVLWQLIPLVAAGRFGMGFDLIGIAITATALANLVALPLAGRLVDRVGWRMPPSAAAITQCAGLLLIAVGDSAAAFWIGVVLLGVAGAFIGPALATSMVEITPAAALSSVTGLQRTVGDIGFVLGPVIVGLLADVAGVDEVGSLLVTAALVLVTGVWWAVATRRPGAVLA